MTNRFVLDASAAVEVLGAQDPDPALRRRVLGGYAAAPELIDLEVLSSIRKYVRSGAMAPTTADHVIKRLGMLPVERSPHRPLVRRVWELRHAISAYDAAYIALAEELGVPVVTTDGKLARSDGHRTQIELYPAC
ncbi:type II toxin-antitoxin system VapC family toxin [Amycolatopsis alkalitolerans]|uniref:Ribonuclease VapC n=1 Tax=Amycolatopsis alkalitolerans TaxID=2547244 RepID=A0A5C4M6L4_9PSEU|nr:type II toxin-antitoxin system VapC family toxin [Amycolatopsis alkalitolerans]TNC26437.1 type II toxin-antitoxin system VapC family toxin [Amycolatopsis alkalitolerans]